MKKYLYYIGILFVCFLQQSCTIQSMVAIEPYRPKKQIVERIPVSEQDTIVILSNQNYFYYDFFKWEEIDSGYSGEYIIYVIEIYARDSGRERLSDDNKDTIELISVEVTECGNPLPFSIFQRTYSKNHNPELIRTPYVVKDCNIHKFFVKINKPELETRDFSVKYHIKINGIPVIKEHRYRKQFSIETKHYKLFKFWLCNCH